MTSPTTPGAAGSGTSGAKPLTPTAEQVLAELVKLIQSQSGPQPPVPTAEERRAIADYEIVGSLLQRPGSLPATTFKKSQNTVTVAESFGATAADVYRTTSADPDAVEYPPLSLPVAGKRMNVPADTAKVLRVDLVASTGKMLGWARPR